MNGASFENNGDYIMNYLRNTLYAGLVLGLAAISACNDPRTLKEQSEILHEQAKVSETVYVPSTHGSGAGPTIDFNGNVGLAVTSVSTNSKYAVVFECQHGKFISEGEDERHKDLWQRMRRDMPVDVTYQELYEATYQDTNGDGERELLERKLVGFDFLDAQPLSK